MIFILNYDVSMTKADFKILVLRFKLDLVFSLTYILKNLISGRLITILFAFNNIELGFLDLLICEK